MEKQNVILDKSIEFALKIIEFSEELDDRKKFVISKQILRSGTSVGANIREAQSPQSKADFIHKLKIADKELNETEYWMMLCENSNSYPNPDKTLYDLKTDIKKIISKIIITTKKGM